MFRSNTPDLERSEGSCILPEEAETASPIVPKTIGSDHERTRKVH